MACGLFLRWVLRQLAEGQEALHGRIDRLQSTVSRMEDKIDHIDARLIHVEMNQTADKERLTGIEKRILKLE